MSRTYGPGRNIPNVNASLIRELRMIVNQFFRTKENINFDNSFKRPEKTHVIALTCEPCLRSAATTPEPAITVSKGFAVCHRHLLARD